LVNCRLPLGTKRRRNYFTFLTKSIFTAYKWRATAWSAGAEDSGDTAFK